MKPDKDLNLTLQMPKSHSPMRNQSSSILFVFCIVLSALGSCREADKGILSLYPKADTTLRTFMEDGGWCWYQDPRVIIHQGKLIIGGLSGVSGDVRVGVFDLAKDSALGVVTLQADFQKDDHNVPVFHARSDGRILTCWAMHGNENIHYFSLSEPGDPLLWSEPLAYTHDYERKGDWGGVTYMNLYAIADQAALYNFYRDGSNWNPWFIRSYDEGTSWGERHHLLADEVDGRQRPYAKYMQEDGDHIGISFTDGHPRNFGNSLYYARFDGESFYKADGSRIKHLTDGPLRTSEAEQVYRGSDTGDKPKGSDSVPGSAWTITMDRDASGKPQLAYSLFMNMEDIRYRLASWDGSSWKDREIAFAGKGLYPRESSYSGLLALDPEDPSKVVISSCVDPVSGAALGGEYEIYAGRVEAGDSTGTIDWIPLTANSNGPNIRPILVSGEGYTVLLWLQGPWSTYTEYDCDVVGHILHRPDGN